MGTRFVVKQTRTRGEHLQSKQIDLIIYDDASPILFQEGDVVILTPDSVRAIIEIKANLENKNVEDVLRAANGNGEFIFSGKKGKSKKMFNGVFSYERLDGSRNMERILGASMNQISHFQIIVTMKNLRLII